MFLSMQNKVGHKSRHFQSHWWEHQESYSRIGQRSAIDSECFLMTFLAFALVEARGPLLHFKGLHNHRGVLAQRQKWTKMAIKGGLKIAQDNLALDL